MAVNSIATDSKDRKCPEGIRTFLICLGLTALTLLVFWRVQTFDFIEFDDDIYISQNTALKAGLSAEGLKWAWESNLITPERRSEYWQPLTLLTRLADYNLYGYWPGGHHRTSLIIHILAGLALFGALKQLTGLVWRSAIVAALFLVHPMHVEPVAWLSARKDLVSGLFYILTIWAYAWHAKNRSWMRYGLFFATFLLANMAKPMAVTLPAILLLLDIWPLERVRIGAPSWAREMTSLFLKKVPLFLVAGGVSVLAYLVQRRIGALADDQMASLGLRVGTILTSGMAYLLKALVPLNLSVFYPVPEGGVGIATALICGASLLAITWLVVKQYAVRPWLPFGWFWFLIILAPVSGVIQIGEHAMADRYTYLAFTGLFIALVWQIAGCINAPLTSHFRLNRKSAAVIAFLLIATYSALSFVQVQTWRNHATVFIQALKATDENYVAHFNLGGHLFNIGMIKEGSAHLSEAARIRKPFLDKQREVINQSLERGDHAAAIPRIMRILLWVPWDWELRQKLVVSLFKTQQSRLAVMQFAEVLKFCPDAERPYLETARLMIAQNLNADAIRLLKELLRVHPDSKEGMELLASLEKQ